MRMQIFSPVFLFIILLLTMEFAICCCGRNSSFGCVPRERKALLKFKASLSDPANRLSSWDEYGDCCAWDGVMCHKTTGHVIELDLRKPELYYYSALQGDQLDSSLLELKYLSYLDLSYNDFQFSPIPTFLGSMKQLQYLNLSNSNFGGHVPHNLGNLSSLRTLVLNDGALIIDDLMWASNLTSLENLDLSWVDLSQTKSLLKVLNMLPSLSVLRLFNSGLDNTNLGHGCVNSTVFTHIKYLDLSWNRFEGDFPCFLQNMTSLRFLDLSNNRFNTSDPHRLKLRNIVDFNFGYSFLHNVDWISEFLSDKCHLKSLNLVDNQFYGELSGLFKNSSACWIDKLGKLSLRRNKFYGNLPEEMGRLKQLNQLYLSDNNFSGPIPWSIGKLSALTELDLSDNMLSGSIPSSLGNMKALRVLDFASNQLSGEIPVSLGQLSNLEKLSALTELDLSDNMLSGSIPSSLANMRSLRKLDLHSNQLSGEIPTSLGQLSNLESIDFRYNSFNDGTTLSEAHFANLSKLESLFVNMLKFQVRLDWVPNFQLKILFLKSCEIGGQVPQWLQTQKSLSELRLSNCSISGALPNWLQYMNLIYLNLSNNHIEGPIQYLCSNITDLDLSNNMINHLPRNIGHMMPLLWGLDLSHNSVNGSIPDSLCEMKALNFLDLSNNYLSGNIPDCWENSPNLHQMRLSSNELSGIIPKSIGGAFYLRLLQLNNNSLTGQLPSSLKNCTDLYFLDVGGNKLSGNLPGWIGKYLFPLKYLILRNNDLYGLIPSEFCQLSNLQIMDLAHNKLSGKIPYCIGNLSCMVIPSYYIVQNEGSLEQVIVGVEREYTGVKYLVNLDLSNNNLIGEIPSELTNLSALIGLNLSHNHLEGKIPATIGDLKSLISLDLSNNKLFGTIPDSLSYLTSLSHLNLSNNNLWGQIPKGNQLQTLDYPSIYDGNPGLCGAPLIQTCHDDKASKASNGENHVATDEGDRAEKIYLYGFIISGFATGFWGIIGVLVFKKSWRQALFRYIEVVS